MKNPIKEGHKRVKLNPPPQEVKQERTEPAVSHYDELSLYYANEKFNEKIQNSIKAIALHAYEKEDQPFIKRYPICKILTFLAKKLFLNGLELIFLQYILEENGWSIHDEVITRNYKHVKDFMNNADVNDEKEYLCMLFYLTLISYSAKYFLNDADKMTVFEVELNIMVDNFQAHFKEWSRNNSAITSKISPKSLNKIFRQLNTRDSSISYFLMVESIIDISPPYNNSQTNEKKEKKKPAPTRDQENSNPQLVLPSHTGINISHDHEEQ